MTLGKKFKAFKEKHHVAFEVAFAAAFGQQPVDGSSHVVDAETVVAGGARWRQPEAEDAEEALFERRKVLRLERHGRSMARARREGRGMSGEA